MAKQIDSLIKKYKLPKLVDLDRDFLIKSMDEKEDFIRGTVRHIYDSYDFYARILSEIIQPDTNISAMKEASELNLQERALVVELHMKMMHTLKTIIELNLDYSEKAAAEIIRDTYDEWQQLKVRLKKIVGKLKQTWEKETKIDSERGYFG